MSAPPITEDPRNTMNSAHELASSVSQYIFGARDATADQFDQVNRLKLDEVVRDIGSILSLKVLLQLKGNPPLDANFQAFALTTASMDIIISSLHLARQRASLESLALLRLALESASTALHISFDARAYEEYCSGRYKSTRAISFAKHHIAELGEMWSALSQAVIHVTINGYGPTYRLRGENELVGTISLAFDVREGEQAKDEMLLAHISLVAVIVLRIIELSVLQKDETREGWLVLAGSGMSYLAHTEVRLIKRRKEIDELAKKMARAQAHQEADTGNEPSEDFQ